ncbi:MAG: sigma-70 family RNA polymerase sigma factor [Myxococcota bacterium]
MSTDERTADVQLAQRAAAGERAAQAAVARRILSRVRRIARSLATSAADADDAAQQALLEVLRSCHSFRGDATLEQWAGRIANRAALRHLTRERKQQTASADEVPQHAAPPHPQLSDELPRDLRAYLHALPEAQRTAIVLHHAFGHSLDEVASMTEVSRNTVKGRLRLGVAALRKLVRREQRIGAPADDAEGSR